MALQLGLGNNCQRIILSGKKPIINYNVSSAVLFVLIRKSFCRLIVDIATIRSAFGSGILRRRGAALYASRKYWVLANYFAIVVTSCSCWSI